MRTPNARTALHARRSLAVFAAVISAALSTGCGSSNRPHGVSADGGPLLQYAECLRAHGIASFPDPSPHAGLAIPNDINPQSPAFKSAQQACARFAQPAKGQRGSPESRRLELLALARCMRAQGAPTFSDPTNSPPPPSSGNALGANGAYLALGTAQERESPTYKRAAAACGHIP
jgi:hypothetical protein